MRANVERERAVRDGIYWIYRCHEPSDWSREYAEQAFLQLIHASEPLEPEREQDLRMHLTFWEERVRAAPGGGLRSAAWQDFQRVVRRCLGERGIRAPTRCARNTQEWVASLQINRFRVRWAPAGVCGIGFERCADGAKQWITIPLDQLPVSAAEFATVPEDVMQVWYERSVLVPP